MSKELIELGTKLAKTPKKESYITFLVNGLIGLTVVSDHSINQELINHIKPLTNLTNSTIKDKVIILLYLHDLTVKNIFDVLKESTLQNIYHIIKREDRETGLLYEGLVEVKENSINSEKYGLTNKGIEYIKRFIRLEEDKKEKIIFKKKIEEDFVNYYDEVSLYLHSLNISEIKNYAILDFNNILENNSEFAEKLEDDFQNQITLTKQILQKEYKKNIDVILENVPKHCYKNIGSLDYNSFNKLIIIDGMIKGRSDRRPQITSSKFECPACGNIIPFLQKEKKFEEPTKCGCGRKGKFILLSNELVTVQRLELEEFSENLKGVNEPRSINLILQNSVCSPENQKDFNPGMRIKFWGTLKSDWMFKGNSKQTLLDYYFEVNGYEVLDQSLEFSVKDEDKKEVLDFIKEKDFFDKLANSFCPEISNNLDKKKALLLSAVKGQIDNPKFKRDRIHILLVSNPGEGKTVMVRKLIDITPYSRFTSGLNSSKAGLTAAVVKDEFLGGWRLSAGAVPLANNGICVVDELDKFDDDDKKGLNGVMEEGEVVVDKATIHQKLRANTVIVATCNPKNERFNSDSPFIDQLSLPRSLVDRFDLIFASTGNTFGNPFLDIVEDNKSFVDDEFISKFLLLAMNHKVIVNKNIKKQISEIAYNLKLGYSGFNFGWRQFHALYRLSVAYSKINFRKEVIREDIISASKILISSLESLGINFVGSLE